MVEAVPLEAAAARPLESGVIFAGRYQIERLLGEGDRKRIYLAHDKLLNDRQVALSLIKPAAAQADPAGTAREVAALAQTGNHDNIVTLHDCGTADDTDYLVTAYLSGGNLRDYLRERTEQDNPLSAQELMQMGRQLARALAHVHGHGLIHRDVAPANVWLDERHVAHLGDFDSVIRRDARQDPDAWPVTTEAYEAPEQSARQRVDERSDLYSLGAVLYEAVTGERPSRTDPEQTATRLAAFRADLPRTLRTTICRLLAQSPGDRPNSANELLQALTPPRGTGTPDAGLLPWAETLPFPLAAILWHYEGETEPAAKLDYLLKFFEALAHLSATIQLSACLSDRAFLDAHKTAWFGGRRTLDLHRASFGTWVELSTRLAATGRPLLAAGGEHAAHYLSLFTAPDSALVQALTSQTLTGILFKARDARNAWSGHGGVASRRIVDERLWDLKALLTKTQGLLGWSFEPWTLLVPGPMILLRGVYEVTATILTGTNPAFAKKQIQLTHPVDATRLYLMNDANTTALELAPLIRVIAGSKAGQDACYLYSQLDAQQVRWVSYHHHAEPELLLPDTDVAQLLATLA